MENQEWQKEEDENFEEDPPAELLQGLEDTKAGNISPIPSEEFRD